jgi:hypothetical protein
MSTQLPADAFAIRVATDGRSVFIAQGDVPLRVNRLDLATGRLAQWKMLAPDDLTGVLFVGNPVLSADGKAYAYDYGRFLMDMYLMQGLPWER